MTKGAPDYVKTFANIGFLGQGVTAYSISGSITAENTGYADLTIPSTGTENIYIGMVVSCNDDEAINLVTATRVSDGWIWFSSYFINRGEWSLQTVAMPAGETARITFSNNHTDNLTFKAIVYWVTRTV